MRYPKDHKDAAREKLVRASGSHAKKHGFGETGVASLAASAGVTTGALYKHFDGKADLTQALIDRNGLRLLAAYADVFDRVLTPEDFVRDGISVFVGHIDANPEIFRFMVGNAADDTLVDEIGLPLAALTRSILAQQGKGLETAETLVRMALGTVFAATSWWSRHRTPERSVFERTLADFVWGGVVNAGIEPTDEPVDLHALAQVIAEATARPLA